MYTVVSLMNTQTTIYLLISKNLTIPWIPRKKRVRKKIVATDRKIDNN